MTERPTLPLDSPDLRGAVLKEVSKRFSAIRALDRVDLVLRGGEIHALCGENGAGKSTLIQILGGVFPPDSGRIEIGGKPVRFRDPAAALAEGIGIIYQELNLVEPFTVAENLALGHEPRIGPWIDRRAIRRQARAVLADLQFDLDPEAQVSGLTIGQRQQVEIAKALGRQVRILVLDEPTAALSRAETDQLFRIVRSLRARGLAILYVSHHLEEVFEIADRITVLRDGRRMGTWNTAELTLPQLVSAMVGQAVQARARPPRNVSASPLLRIVGANGRILRGADLEVHPGEVVGLTGLAGAGHEELSAALFGAKRLISGRIEWKNRPLRPRHPLDARRAGIAYVPPDRRREGLIPAQGITENLTLACLHELAAAGWIKQAARRRCAETWCRRFDVALSHATRSVATLSGGNQQRVLLCAGRQSNPSCSFSTSRPGESTSRRARPSTAGLEILSWRAAAFCSSRRTRTN